MPLAEAGYHVVAPDQRGFGRTKPRVPTSDKVGFSDDLSLYHPLNLTADVIALVFTLGYQSVAAVIGHDFGAQVAACCAMIRPDIFKSVVMLSTPFIGFPDMPLERETIGMSLCFRRCASICSHRILAQLDWTAPQGIDYSY